MAVKVTQLINAAQIQQFIKGVLAKLQWQISNVILKAIADVVEPNHFLEREQIFSVDFLRIETFSL